MVNGGRRRNLTPDPKVSLVFKTRAAHGGNYTFHVE